MSGLERVARTLVRRRRTVAGVWVLATVLLVPAAMGARDALDVAARVDGSESAAVETVLREQLRSPYARYGVLVTTGLPRPGSPAGDRALQRVRESVAAVPGVGGVLSYLETGDPLFVLDDGSYLLVGLEPGEQPADALVAPLRAATARLTERLRETHPEATLRWTGETMLNHDLRQASAEDARSAEQRVLPLTLVLLVVAFGAVVAALLPIGTGVLAIVLALGAAALLARVWPLSILLENIVSMIGLGLGIDYALLMVSRFREAAAAGAAPEDAAVEAARHAGATILLSGAAVAVGFLGLLLVPLNELRSIGVGGAIVVTVSVLLATTLLPGVLASLGPRVQALRVLRRPPAARPDAWRRWGRFVVARPLLVLALALPPLLLLSAQAPRLNTNLPRGEWLPQGMESVVALDRLEAGGRSGVVHALRVVLELPHDRTLWDQDGWRAATALTEALAADARVARVQSLPALVGAVGAGPATARLVPQEVRRMLASDDGRYVLLDVLPADGIAFPDLTVFVRDLRARSAAQLAAMPDARIRIGGMPAFNADYEDAIARRLGLVAAVVLGGTLIGLLLGFRSLLIPLKALFLNLLSVGAAFGLVVLVFQDGIGAELVGLSGPVDGFFPALPVLVFCIVFGLSMDYEVFLVARVAEARRAGLGERDAIVEGLARTGGIITSAAAIMVAVFAGFALGDFLVIKVLGFALAAAVLVDATVVRTAVGPALLCLAGRWNWWPGGVPGETMRERGGEPAAPASVAPDLPVAPTGRYFATHELGGGQMHSDEF